MKAITAVTVGRSDFGIFLPVLRAIQEDPELDLRLIVTGAHLCPRFGMTVNEILSNNIEIDQRVEISLSSATPEAIGTTMGLATLKFAQLYSQQTPEFLLLLGDRYEMHSAAVAAIPFNIPMAHIHGGENTRGAIDDAFRHAITKYSHVHFVATEEHRRRVVQLGEEPWRVIVAGAPALDNLSTVDLMSTGELEQLVGLSFDPPPVVVTYHPVTLQYDQTVWQIRELLVALQEQVLLRHGLPILITRPNADTRNDVIQKAIDRFADRHEQVKVVDNLGTRAYFSVMHHARALVGNSSSGIIESASFRIPVVNVGIRQEGRPDSGNVVHVGNSRTEISGGLAQALSSKFREGLADISNTYGCGNAAHTIVDSIKKLGQDRRSLVLKKFYDLPDAAA